MRKMKTRVVPPLYFLCCLASCLLLAAAAVAAPLAEPSATARPRSVQARFFQEKHLKMLDQPLTARGVFAFQAPGSLRWEYLYPLRSLFLAHDGATRRLVEREDGSLARDAGMGTDAMRLALEEIGAWLSGRFADNPAFRVERADERTVVLTPRDPDLAAVVSRVELRLSSGREGLIESILINEGPDDWTRLTFSDALLDRPLEERLFTKP